MNYIENNIWTSPGNLKVSYIDEGKNWAPVIIFIHGFPFNKFMWTRQVEALKDNYRVITYDVRGHGNTGIGELDFSLDLFVEDLLSVMDGLKIDKTVLCGLSMGGYIALNAIEKYPDRFTGLILCDTNCIADTSEAKGKRLKAIDSIKINGVKQYAGESIRNLFARESFTKRKEEVEIVREMIVNTAGQALINTLGALSERKETCSKLQDINVPVLIMVGNEDKITPPEAAKFMHEKIKGSVLKIIQDAGHLSNLENPDEFDIHLKKFMTSVYPRELG